jgi:hypothetical protein
VTAVSVMFLRFLVPKPVGMADNGDGWRLLCQLGGHNSTVQKYVQMNYPPAWMCPSNYISSQMWLDRPVSWLGKVIGLDSVLNLYLLGAVCILLAAFGITIIVLGLKLTRRWQIAVTILLLLVVADSAFFGYFAAPLSEAAAFLGILLMTGGLLVMQQDNRWRYFGTAVTIAGAMIGVNAKVQTLVILPLLVLALLAMRRNRVLKALVVVVVGTGTYLTQTSGASAAGAELREANMFNSIFMSILEPGQPNREYLRDLGLPESYDKYAGIGFWAHDAARTDPLYPQYVHVINRNNVIKFYLEHPGRMIEILQRSAIEQLVARPAMTGSFEEDSGEPPYAQEFRVPVFSGIGRLVSPLGLFFLIPLWSFIVWAGLRVWRSRREIAVVILLLMGTAISQFLLAALAEGGGIEGIKHQLISLFSVLLAGVFAIVSWSGNVPPVVGKLLKGRRARGSDVQSPAQVAVPVEEEVRQ